PSRLRDFIRELTGGSGVLAVSSWGDPEDGEGDEAPWRSRPASAESYESLPQTLRAVQANMIYIEKMSLPPRFLHRIRSLAAFQNPEFYRAQASRRSTFGIPRVIHCDQDFEKYIA